MVACDGIVQGATEAANGNVVVPAPNERNRGSTSSLTPADEKSLERTQSMMITRTSGCVRELIIEGVRGRIR